MNEIKFTIPGAVQAQQRPRFSRQNGHVRTYDDKKSRNYKAHVQKCAARYAPEQLIDSAIELHIDVFHKLQQSGSKQLKADKLAHRVRPTVKPDLDNLAKGIKDALTGMMWIDDAQVVDLIMHKYYAVEPCAVVTIKY